MPRRTEDPSLLRVIGERIHDARRKAGLSQERLAERLGIDVVTLSRLETGRHAPSVPTIIRIADALGVPVSTLVDVGLPPPARPEADAVAVAEWMALWGELSPERRALALRVVRELVRG